MISGTASTGGNNLLAALPLRERENLQQHGEQVPLTPDEILGEPGERIRHVYFPADGFIALVAEVDGHDALALGLVGSEGMLGAPLVLGSHTSPLRTRVLAAGSALRLRATEFLQAVAVAPGFERLLRRYLGVRLEQFALTAACASFHVVEARLACWLLMAQDRSRGDRFYLTHERLARLLGVRRSGVSTAACVLQGRRLIRYTRGHVLILDRPGLEAAACGCYRTVKNTVSASAAAPILRDELPGADGALPLAAQPPAVSSPGEWVAPHRH